MEERDEPWKYENDSVVAKDCLYLPKITFDAEPQNECFRFNAPSRQLVHGHKSPTCQAVPLVDGKEAVGGDGDDGR